MSDEFAGQMPGWPGAQGPVPAPPRSSRTLAWILGGVATLVIVAVALAVILVLKPFGHKDFQDLTPEMFIGADAFPATEPVNGPKILDGATQGIAMSPAECEDYFVPPTSKIGVMTQGPEEAPQMKVLLGLATKAVNLRELVGRCGSFGPVGTQTGGIMSRLNLVATDDRSITVRQIDEGTLLEPQGPIKSYRRMALYRGLYVTAEARQFGGAEPSDDDVAVVNRLFDAQLAKLG